MGPTSIPITVRSRRWVFLKLLPQCCFRLLVDSSCAVHKVHHRLHVLYGTIRRTVLANMRATHEILIDDDDYSIRFDASQ